uniref:H/ACA ribonucleoprotein complex non-core subunit NAF1 n=1 Tax=Diabrotica virgifera virgifera TaxID=50390 RepID=A0A6P7FIR5_DIAVI
MDQIKQTNNKTDELQGAEPGSLSSIACKESEENTGINTERDAENPLQETAVENQDFSPELNASKCDEKDTTTGPSEINSTADTLDIRTDPNEINSISNTLDMDISKSKDELLSTTSEEISTTNQLDIVKKAEPVVPVHMRSSLQHILQYNSDDSEDEDIQTPLKPALASSSSSSDSESDIQEVDNAEEDEDVDEFVLSNDRRKTKVTSNPDCELLDPSLLVNLTNLKIDYEKEEFTHIGNIANFIDTTVTVEAIEKSESYDMDTVLFIEDGSSKKPFGGVTDVIGPVSQPVYCVQLPSSKEIENLGLKQGMKVYSAPKSEYAKYVFLKDLLKMKGTDASGVGDQEQTTDEDNSSGEEEDEMPTSNKRPFNRGHNQRPFNNRSRFRGNMGNRNNVINRSNIPNAPNGHMLPHGFDPTIPPPFMSNTGFGFQNHSSPIPTWPYQQRGFHTYFQSPRRFQRIRGNHRNYNGNLPPNS